MARDRPWILMCSPDHFGIEYEINAWMSRSRQADRDLAMTQWTALRDCLISLGAVVDLVEPVQGLPDLVFTANAAMMCGPRCIVSRFRPQERRPEEAVYGARLRELGFEVLELPEGMYFEGAGDALFCGRTLYAGYRIRSHVRSLQHVARLIGREVIPLELVDPRFYHLDTCFCPVHHELVIWYPGAFDSYARQVIESADFDRIALTEDEAAAFAANAAVIGKTVVSNTGCPDLEAQLQRRGLQLIQTPLSEFTKSGGSARCLTLRLDGEDAAE